MRGRGVLVGAGVVLVVVVAWFASSGGGAAVPYGARSTAPDGLGAFTTLVRDRGVVVSERPASSAASARLAAGDVLLVPAPDLATAPERRAFVAAARRGATVLYGTMPDRALGFVPPPSRVELTTTPAVPQARGACDVASLEGLGAVDVAFSTPTVTMRGEQSCYGTAEGAFVVVRTEGAGRLVVLGGPEFLVNARLWPDKERGGTVLANAEVGLALLGLGRSSPAAAPSRLVVVAARPSPGAAGTGQRPLTSLLPVGVQLFLVQLLAAVVVYSWWRGRRFGEPVRDRVPVDVAGAELVVAVGDLHRRRGDARAAAASLRADTRRVLCDGLGLPPGAAAAPLVAVVAARTGRTPADLTDLLADPPEGRTVSSTDDVVQLAHVLDQLRSEVLHEQPV
ncbi:MAG: DUF4350 domain-containing protein [Actinomycetes bacterium]